jgi:hypothetical protein
MHSFTCPYCGTDYFDLVSVCDAADCPGYDPTRQKNLPPDPENMNDDRAAWAGAALREFQRQTGTDDENAVNDLLGDLMHWCDRKGVDFDDELTHARWHYDAETTPEVDRCVLCGLRTDPRGVCPHCLPATV